MGHSPMAKTKVKQEANFILVFQPSTIRSGEGLWINTADYLFSTKKIVYGVAYKEAIQNTTTWKQTLCYAMNPTVDGDADPDSLDAVFRKALKELAGSLYDVDPGSGAERPSLVSARSLELKLVEIIQAHYKTSGHDFIDFMKSAFRLANSPFHRLTEKSRCRMYIEKIVHRLDGLGKENADVVKAAASLVPTEMFLWTDAESQSVTDANVTNVAADLFKERTGKTWPAMFIKNYASEVERLLASHSEFLAESVRTSELFTYLCFGLTTDNPTAGSLTMATSYLAAYKERAKGHPDDGIYWNFPLAVEYFPKLEKSAPPPITMDMDGLYNKANDLYWELG